MRIGLVFAPYNHKKFEENITIVDDEFGVFPPVNLAYAAAIMEKAGHEVILIDGNARNLSTEQIITELEQFRPDLLGAYFSTYMFHQTLDVMRAAKQRLQVPVMAGGINLLLYPEESLTHQTIDYGVVGSGQKNVPMLLSRLENGESVDDVPGLAYRADGKVVINEPPVEDVPFDDYPFPARHLLPNELYYSFISQLKNFTVMMTQLGCPYKCRFCAIARIPYRYRSPENVFEETKLCLEKFGVREIDFFDADFNIRRKRVLEIIELWRRAGLKFEWSCRSRVDNLDDELVREMAASGCRQVYLGIETADEEAIHKMKKGINSTQTQQAITLCKKYDIKPLGFFMVGNPGETEASIKRTVKYARKLGLDFAQFSRTIPKPRTEMDVDLIEKTGYDYWKQWVLGNEVERRIPNPWTTLSEEQIEKLTKKAYYSFYFRPTMVLRHVARVRSFSELIRFVKVGLQMLVSWFYDDTQGVEKHPETKQSAPNTEYRTTID